MSVAASRSRCGKAVVISADHLLSLMCGWPRSMRLRDLAGDGPDEAAQLARNGHDDLVGHQAPGGKPAEARAQARLRGPRDVGHRLGQPGLAPRDHGAHPRGQPVVMRDLHQNAPGRRIACFGDRPMRRRGPLECSPGTSPTYAIKLRGLGKRQKSWISAASVIAAISCTPRSACSAATSGARCH